VLKESVGQFQRGCVREILLLRSKAYFQRLEVASFNRGRDKASHASKQLQVAQDANVERFSDAKCIRCTALSPATFHFDNGKNAVITANSKAPEPQAIQKSAREVKFMNRCPSNSSGELYSLVTV